MVEYKKSLDLTFAAMSDPIRRDILKRLTERSLTVSEIAKPYSTTFSAIAKHVQILEKAHLVEKRARGTERDVYLLPMPIKVATFYLRRYGTLDGTIAA